MRDLNKEYGYFSGDSGITGLQETLEKDLETLANYKKQIEQQLYYGAVREAQRWQALYDELDIKIKKKQASLSDSVTAIAQSVVDGTINAAELIVENSALADAINKKIAELRAAANQTPETTTETRRSARQDSPQKRIQP
jgi:hypothetical protein